MIFGIDEVGRGALAGPLAVGVVMLGETSLDGLTDSKLLSPKKRLYYNQLIRQQSAQAALGWVSAANIDRLGMTKSLELAIIQALDQLNLSRDDQIIIDGTVNYLKNTKYNALASTMKKADLLVPSVSAASVIAKVARDNYMHLVGQLFPDYGFNNHVGYGTKAHLAAIEAHGPSSLHRLSFAPMNQTKLVKVEPKVTSGQAAEAAVADYLMTKGYEIIERNWRTRWCEIDIVARKNNKIWLVEVKYRVSDTQGSGLDYITVKKLQQMKLAARFWQHFNKYSGDIALAAIEVSGQDYKISQLIKDL